MIKDCFGKPLPKNAYVIRHTEIENFVSCPRRWLFLSHNGLNLESAKKNDKLRLGTIWHKVMESYYDPNAVEPDKLQRAKNTLTTALQDDRAELEASLGDAIYYPENVERMQKEEELLSVLLEGYPYWADNEAEPKDTELLVDSVEKRFVVPIYTPDTRKKSQAFLAVKLDGIVIRHEFMWVLEHKTRGVSTKVHDPDGLPLDMQLGLQILALSRALEGYGSIHTVRGALYNLVRKQKPGPRVKSPIYGRHQVFRSTDEIGRLEAFLYKTYREMRRVSKLAKDCGWKAGNLVRYNPQIWGGFCNWGCAVKNICESLNRGEDVEYLLTVDLKPREKDIWQVLAEEMDEN